MRYIIGIDLGTTNSCVSYVDTQDPRATIQSFKIPQLVIEGSFEHLPTLPSACYLAAPQEFPKGALNLPWDHHLNFFVGKFALQQGAKIPTRLVQSAKSWLCHSAANRRDKILPLESDNEEMRISPVEATARYLKHIREAWNHNMARGDVESEFEGQEIILTVPASFDEIARSLTVEAARLAGFDKMNLLEEPQAAFYSWISQHEKDWEKHLSAGSTVLVCDVGGGTTDFSLIEVVVKEGALTFQRMAVGDHLLLGGDNMDAAIAHRLEILLEEEKHVLSRIQRLRLRHEARNAKEALLKENKGDAEHELYRVLLQGSGSNVIQGALSVTLHAAEVRKSLIEGFLGGYSWAEALQLKKTAGFRSMGLPYADEPSITKHLAHFLSSNAGDDHQPKKPDFVLFNGGAMKPPLFQQAIIDNLKAWFGKEVSVLPSYNLDLAVARGAAYYGKVRQGMGVRIGGGMARGYYLLLDTKDEQGLVVSKAMTLLPRGSEDGSSFEPETTFQLKPNTPVVFQIATSHVRLHDLAGDLIDVDPKEMQMLPPIQT
ncbi:MAG: Hsp70 family protein, partial [Parachlamydiaceae bacterium]|nr:Hsp70 family protein [Parachlamydiaceae bacterium]